MQNKGFIHFSWAGRCVQLSPGNLGFTMCNLGRQTITPNDLPLLSICFVSENITQSSVSWVQLSQPCAPPACSLAGWGRGRKGLDALGALLSKS